MRPLALPVAQRRDAREEHGRDGDRDQQQHARAHRRGRVVARLAARKRELRDEQVHRRQRGERRQPDRGGRVRDRREAAARQAHAPPWASRPRRGSSEASAVRAVATAIPSMIAPTLPPATAITRPTASRVPANSMVAPESPGTAPLPAGRPRRRGSRARSRSWRRWPRSRAGSRRPNAAPIGTRTGSESEQRHRPEQHRLQGAAKIDPGSTIVALGKARCDRAGGRRLERERRDGADQDDREQRREERVLPTFEHARRSELEHGVERVREADRERQQESRPDQCPPRAGLLGGPVDGHRHRGLARSGGISDLRPASRAALPGRRALAERARMNRRSESRFRYTSASGLISTCSDAASASRSARRQTDRATCSRAAASVPPGSTKLVSGSSPALNRSQSASSASPSPARRAAGPRPRRARTGRPRGRRVRSGRVRARPADSVPGRREREPDQRVELVDGAERGDTRIQLRRAGAVAETGLAGVTRARVDARQAHRLVALPWHGSRLRR